MTVPEIVQYSFANPCHLNAADEAARVSGESAWAAADEKSSNDARAKVLIVDDQRLIADTLAEILSNARFEAVPAYDAFDPLDNPSRFHPQSVLTDVLM